jgi:hypothetical protein
MKCKSLAVVVCGHKVNSIDDNQITSKLTQSIRIFDCPTEKSIAYRI